MWLIVSLHFTNLQNLVDKSDGEVGYFHIQLAVHEFDIFQTFHLPYSTAQ